jgi:protein arginine N-methyltransferase 2
LEDPNFGPFDGIFFDTYAETYADMRAFFEALPRLLAPGGVFSYFNGVAPFNPFFHGVACEFIKTELAKLGLETTFVPLQVDQIQHDTWDGVKRRYWQFDCYHLPIAARKS